MLKKITIPILNKYFWLLITDKNSSELNNKVLYKRVDGIIKGYDIKYLKRIKGGVFEDTKCKNDVIFVYISDEADALSLIVHECTHIVDFMSKFFMFRNEMEFRAYLMEWLVKRLLKELKLYRRKK